MSKTTLAHNRAAGGAGGAAQNGSLGVGGAVSNLGVFAFDAFTVLEKNHASTSKDDFP